MVRSWFVVAWCAGFLAGIALVLTPDRMLSQTAKALCFFCFFPFALVAWSVDVIRHGSFNDISKVENPFSFWSFVALCWCIALAIAVLVVYRLVKL